MAKSCPDNYLEQKAEKLKFQSLKLINRHNAIAPPFNEKGRLLYSADALFTSFRKFTLTGN